MFHGKPLTDILREVEGGQFIAEVSEDFYAMLEKVKETGQPGTMTIKLRASPTGKSTVSIGADHSTKEPSLKRPDTTFFYGKDGKSLVRDNPDQERLPLVQVVDNNAQAAPLKAQAAE